MLDNKIVQIALIFFAFYIVLQIVNDQVSHEHLDSNVAPVQTVLPVATSDEPIASNDLVTPELAATSSTASANPVVTSTPSAAITDSVPNPVSSVGYDVVAAAPPVLPEDENQNANLFAPGATEVNNLFGQRNQVEPSELIPKVQDAELYGGLAPNPAMNQNFLNNRWSMGIDTSVGKFNYVNDIRGLPHAPPMNVVAPWQNPTKLPDLYRKSLESVT
jgi:hypothetical protein